jgi:hypothetical protein
MAMTPEERADPMTREDFARLVRDAARRNLAERHPGYPIGRYLTLHILDPLTPPPAGSWIRLWYTDHWATSRWHLFLGDMTWLPRMAAGPALVTACGFETGSLEDLHAVRVEEHEPDDACRTCRARGRMAEKARAA